MSAESVRAFLASAAPDLEIVELPASSQTHTLSAAWGIRAAQIAKTLALSVGGRAVLAVVCGDSRLDNKKVKAVLGGKATMLPPEEAATITGHVLGGVCRFGLTTPTGQRNLQVVHAASGRVAGLPPFTRENTCCAHCFQRRFWPARSPVVRWRRRRMPAVRCLRNPREFPPRSIGQSPGPRTRIEPA